MQLTISFLLLLCLLNIVKTAMYSYSSNRHSEILCGPSLENSSCTPDPKGGTKNCRVPTRYKPLFVERNLFSFDEIDGTNLDGDCCCPTKMHFLDKHHDPYLTNTKNQKKKLAFGECRDVMPFLPIGTCSQALGSCGKCREIQRKYSLLIEENGQYKFDWFKLPSHCACTV